MEINKIDLDNLNAELHKLSRNVASIGDSVKQGIKQGIKEGIKEGNATGNMKNPSTDDSDMAEKINNRIIMRKREEYETSKELIKSKEKTPEQEFNERTLKTQFSTNSYLEQLLKLTRENQEGVKKQTNIFEKPKTKRNELGFIEKTSAMKDSENPYSKFIGNMADLGLQGKQLFSGVKAKLSGSTRRQKDITKYTADINRDKALLSAEEAKLEKLKKTRGKNRDVAAIKEMEEAVKRRKTGIKSTSEKFADTTAEEYLYQKAKSDKNFQFKGIEKDLMKDQLSGNILHSTIKDVFPDKKTTKEKTTKEKTTNQSVSEDTLLKKLDKLLSTHIQKTPYNKDKSPKWQKPEFLVNGRNGKGNVKTSPANDDIHGIIPRKRKDDIHRKRKDDKDIEINASGSVFDIPLREASNPSTSGEYIVGIYKEIKKKTDTPAPKPMTTPSEGGGGMSMMGILSKLGPMLASLGPMLAGAASAIGAVAAPLAVALGGAYAIKKTSDMMDESNQGTTLSDIVVGGGKGFKAFLKGESFTDAFTGHQTERASKNFNREADEKANKALGDQFDKLVKPKFNPNYVTTDQLENLKQLYIDKANHKITATEYDRARNSLMQQSKDSEQESATLKDDFTNVTAGKPKATKQPQSNTPGGGSGGDVPRSSSKEVVDTKSNAHAMSQYSGIDQMTAMTIQAKLIAMEMMAMNNSSDYVNKQKEIMKTAGVTMAEKLYGGS